MICFMRCCWIKFPSLNHEYPTENSIVNIYSDCNGNDPIASGKYCDIRVKLIDYGINLTKDPICNQLFFKDGFYEYTVYNGPEMFVG